MQRDHLGLETNATQSPSKCSVVLRNVYKTLDNKTILNGVNLTAFSGHICAVLGETNSGKSVLLSCLVGGVKVDKGHTWVLGGPPRTKSSKTLTKYIGYMPQEFCLFETMTVLELLAYYGQLYDIDIKYILWRINYFLEVFTLPKTNCTIKNLSFSEKRMVSFVTAVFHRPRLVVLDEPTVGLDIIKKNQVWKYLHHIITTWKPTVIVATNSVEEAFSATKIVYLKNGKIIFDEEVNELRQRNPNKSIDIIVEDLHANFMSNSDENFRINSSPIGIPRNKKLSLYRKIEPRSNVWKLKAVTVRNIKYLTKNIWIIILLWLIPILQVLQHCIYYGQYPVPMPIAVFNREADCVYHPCESVGNCTYFSCHFINLFPKYNVKGEFYDSEFSAKDSVKKELTFGYMEVPENYTMAIIKSTLRNTIDERNATSTDHSISVEIDVSTLDFGKQLKQQLLNAHRLHRIDLYNYYNLSEKYAEIPFKVYEYENLDLNENTVSEVISCVIFSSAMFFSSLMSHSEISNGYLTRNIIAGVTIYEITLSFLITQTLFSTVQAFCFYFSIDFFLSISWQSSLLLLVLLNIAIGICGMSIGLFLGSFINSSNEVFRITLFVYFLNIIMSGIFWPIDSIPRFLQPFANVLPLTMPIRATKAILIQGRQFKSEYIVHAVVSISIWIFVSFAAFVFMIRNKINFIV